MRINKPILKYVDIQRQGPPILLYSSVFALGPIFFWESHESRNGGDETIVN